MSIIRPKGIEVQTELCDGPIEIVVPNIKPAIIKARAESISENANVLPNSFLDGEPMVAKDLKQHISFRGLVEADGHKVQQSGKSVKCHCPFHPDKTPSFSIFESDDYARCYGCGWYGDIFKYEADSYEVDFKQAWKSLNAFLRQEPRIARKSKPAPRKEKLTEAPTFTPKQREERKKYADRLATDTWLVQEVCRKRYEKCGQNWKPTILQQLAKEGSLGWAGDCIAFIYPTGTKYRQWPSGKFGWDCECMSLWRGHLLEKATHVYLTESETDAIALIHTGLEEKKPGHVVIAAPSATTFKKEWATLFKDKAVIFCFDNDKAGEAGVLRIAPMLQPYAAKLVVIDWKEVA